jgi:membrane dipeptidase
MRHAPIIAVLCAISLTLLVPGIVSASVDSKTWPASDEAQQFVKDTIVIGFFASPFGAGWTEDAHMHDYLQRSRDAGITGHDMTLTAATHTWEDFRTQHYAFRSAMAQRPDEFIFVHTNRDIETAHIRGATAVIWNTQTSTILNGDLKRMAVLKEMGIASMILVYNDINRAGCGSLAAFKGTDFGLTDWGRAITDELVRYGIILDLSHTGKKTAMDAMDYMDGKYPGVPYIFSHSLPAGLYKDTPEATERGCYRNITDEEALRVKKSGGYVSPTFTEWMMDGIWPEDITPQQAVDMIDYYVKLVGVDHVGIASGCGELSKILAAVTDELWKRGYSNEQDLWREQDARVPRGLGGHRAGGRSHGSAGAPADGRGSPEAVPAAVVWPCRETARPAPAVYASRRSTKRRQS